jgi:hypothetical protein
VRVRGEARLVDDAFDAHTHARARARARGAIGPLRRLALFRGPRSGQVLLNAREIARAGVRVRSARVVSCGWAAHRKV